MSDRVRSTFELGNLFHIGYTNCIITLESEKNSSGKPDINSKVTSAIGKTNVFDKTHKEKTLFKKNYSAIQIKNEEKRQVQLKKDQSLEKIAPKIKENLEIARGEEIVD